MKELTVVDDSTVSIRLSEAYRPQVFQLAMQAGLMVSPTAVKKYDGEFPEKNLEIHQNDGVLAIQI